MHAKERVMNKDVRDNGRVSSLVINTETRVCMLLVGKGKATNMSADMHNAAYRAMGLNFVYIPFGIDDLHNAVAAIRTLNIRGASVGIPHKQEILKYLDVVDKTAREIGAVNTLVNKDGKLYGYNSDWIGALHAIEEETTLKRGQSAIIVGPGGAGKAIAYALKTKGIDVTLFGRDPQRTEAAAAMIGVRSGRLEDLEREEADLIINATPLGSEVSGHLNESAIPASLLSKGKVAMDAVYLPRDTKFLNEAKRRGCSIVYGYKMLLHQALFQVEAFTDSSAPFHVMEDELKRHFRF